MSIILNNYKRENMEMNQKQIDEMNERFESAVREKLTGFEPEVPHALWGKISAELNQQEFTTANAAKPTIIPIWRNWKVAAAAAIVISLGAGLFMSQNQTNEITSTSSIAKTAATPSTTESKIAVVSVSEKPAIIAETKNTLVNAKSTVATSKDAPVTEITPIVSNEQDTKEELTVAQNNEIVTPTDNSVDMGDIPMFSLKLMSNPTSLNDEITIIQSASESKHKSKSPKTKVIFMGKKFDKKPSIDYTVPVRF
jgi:hypothetical protein